MEYPRPASQGRRRGPQRTADLFV